VEDDGGDNELGSGDKSSGEDDSLSENENSFEASPSADSQETREGEKALPPPDDFQVFAGNLKNIISWSRVKGATCYNIYRSTSQSDWQLISSTTATSFEDEIDLDSLGYYYYRVAAVGEDGSEGEFSEICSNSEVNMSGLFSPAFSSTLISANGEVFFTVPTSSLESTQEISVREGEAVSFPVGVINPATSLYVFSPSGTVFSSNNPAILSLKYNIYLPSEEVKEEVEKYFLSLYYQDEEGNYQKIASRVDWENDRIEADITHFSGYQGFWQQPHGNYGDNTDLCGVCHDLHGSDYKDINICYSCHGNSSGSYTTSVLVDAPGAPSNYFSPNIQAQFSQCEDQSFDPNTMSRHELATGDVLGLLCTTCHTPHKDPSGYTDLLAVRPTYTLYNIRLYSYSTDPLGNDLCYACHGTSPSQYLITPTSSGGLGLINYYSESGGDHESYFEGSKHSTNIGIPSATYRDATGTVSTQIKCLACHEHHGSTVNTRNIRDAIYVTVTVGTGTVNYISTTSISNDTSLCFACHSASSYGFSGEWQNAITSGVYPETGTFPGEAAWNSSPHTSSLAAWPGSSLSGGDCKNCHNPHNTSNSYDMLRTDGIYYATQSVTFSRTTFNFCFECHSPEGPAVHDIESKYNDLSAVERGHMTKSRGATDTIGDTGDFQLPCYDCHDVHGNTSGNQKFLAPFRVTNYDGSASKVREFCTSCHIFADDSTTHRTIEGISCEDSGSVLHLPSAVAEHASTGSQSCLSCHGDVHRPSSTGESGGGTDCSGCHNSIYTAMSTAGGYHHLMDNASATYSSGISTMNCLSCHVDHDIFRPDINTANGARAKNLRYDNSDINVTTTSNRNRDFIATETNGGICLSCHQSELDKTSYTSLNGLTKTGPVSKTDYNASSHDYEATSTFSSDSSTFYANCVKCHNDKNATYQGTTNKFSLHDSSVPRILLASEESHCYQCHSSGGERYGVSGKNPDDIQTIFNNKTYKHPVATSGTHTSYYDEYTTATAGWMTASSGNRHAECADCHNPHVAASGTHTFGSNNAGNAIKGVWGVQVSYGGTAWTSPTFTKVQSITKEYELCFKCHSSWAWGDDPPDATDPNATNYTQTEVDIEFNPNNYGYHPIFAPGKNQPDPSLNSANWEGNYGISGTWTRTGMSGVANDADYVGLTNTFVPPYGASSLLTCSDCHANDDPSGPQGPHGSTQKWFLKKVDTGITYTRKDGTVVSYGASGGDVNLDLGTNDPNNLCLNCHRADVYGRNDSNGVALAENLSRFDHEDAISAGACNQVYNSYGISCMNCHGGDATGVEGGTGNKLGGIHGSNLGSNPENGGNNVGERLLNGACWEGHKRDTDGSGAITGSCYTKDSSDDVNTCTRHGGGRAYGSDTNYAY
jgi:predicted CXXCH cytochrome family protein